MLRSMVIKQNRALINYLMIFSRKKKRRSKRSRRIRKRTRDRRSDSWLWRKVSLLRTWRRNLSKIRKYRERRKTEKRRKMKKEHSRKLRLNRRLRQRDWDYWINKEINKSHKGSKQRKELSLVVNHQRFQNPKLREMNLQNPLCSQCRNMFKHNSLTWKLKDQTHPKNLLNQL